MDIFTLSVSTPVPSAFTLILMLKSTTRLIATNTFINRPLTSDFPDHRATLPPRWPSCIRQEFLSPILLQLQRSASSHNPMPDSCQARGRNSPRSCDPPGHH